MPVTFAVGGTRHKLSMIATVTNQGKTRWMIIDEAFNSDKLIDFLEALIKERTSSKLSEEFSRLKKYWDRRFKTRGYFCATAG